jgi:hypothetical protein
VWAGERSFHASNAASSRVKDSEARRAWTGRSPHRNVHGIVPAPAGATPTPWRTSGLVSDETLMYVRQDAFPANSGSTRSRTAATGWSAMASTRQPSRSVCPRVARTT